MNTNQKLREVMTYGQAFRGAYSNKEINSASMLFMHYHKKIEGTDKQLQIGKLYTFLMLQDEVGFAAIYKKINDLFLNNVTIDWESFCGEIDKLPLRKDYRNYDNFM